MQKYYNLKNILSKHAIYNIIIGERSNGKTFAILEYGLQRYVKYGEQIGVVRRWQDDFRGKRASVMFNGLVEREVIKKLTKNEWDNVSYYSGRWFLSRMENGNLIKDKKPFAYAFSLSTMEHDKSTSYPEITTIFFDEFLSRGLYLPDEFVIFMNVLSTIIRDRNNVKIFMAGNTVNQYSLYFSEMGLNHIKKMQPGDIDIYEYGDSGLKVAVEYADSPNKGKPSDIYFAFDNPKLSMITSGEWEIDVYPHCPCKYLPKDILLTYFIKFDQEILQAEIINTGDKMFTYIHRKTTEIKNPDVDIIFSPEYDARPNWFRKITTRTTSKIVKKIATFFLEDNVYYQDNDVGEIVRNYLIWQRSDSQ